MNYNPKVVSFSRSPAYVHHRALKNMRDNHPVDAVELMRRAVEQCPDNREYRLDLAEMYCEMGCHEQSNRILLDMLSQKDAPVECYYGLALNQFSRNEMESARQALLIYQRNTDNGQYTEDAIGLTAEMDYYESLGRPLNRRNGRAHRIAARACELLRQDEAEKACRLFQRSLSLDPGQMEMRAFYAMALRMQGDTGAALEQASMCVSDAHAAVRSLCVAAQVFWQCGRKEQGEAILNRAIDQKPMGPELRLLVYALGEMEMPRQANEAIKRALWEDPHDKALLHMRAVAMHQSGCSDDQVKSFWLRILRIDPEDSIAGYYYRLACENQLSQLKLSYGYQVPMAEYRRRLTELAESLAGGLESTLEKWTKDDDFRRLVIWALNTGDESCGRAAAMVIASAGDEFARSALREMLYRGDILPEVKLHALVFLRLRGENPQDYMPPGLDIEDGVISDPQQLLKTMPACERQLVRFTGEILETHYGVRALSSLAMMWQTYKLGCSQDNDLLVCTQEAAAALAWNYLLAHGLRVPMGNLVIQFGCKQRRMVFYARRMAAVLEMQEANARSEILQEGKQNDEDH